MFIDCVQVNISKDFKINNIKKKERKKNRIKRKCKFFSVDYNPIDTKDIHRYLMKETLFK